MFKYRKFIRMKDVDATGAIYFTVLPEFVQETFEKYLESKEWNAAKLCGQDLLFPIVHLSANFALPLLLGDEVELQLSLKAIGTTSFTLQGEVYHVGGKNRAGDVELVHVAVSKKTKEAVALPELIKNLLIGI